MLVWKTLPLLALLARIAFARPTHLEERFLDKVLVTDDVVLLDAPAFDSQNAPGETSAAIQAYVYLRTSLLTTPVVSLITKLLGDAGVDVAQGAAQIRERAKLFAAIGLPGKIVSVKADGCSKVGQTKGTSLGDLGQTVSTVSLGRCGNQKVVKASVELSSGDQRSIQASVFRSTNTGFGVISDIDDTVKESNVLDLIGVLRSTFLDTPKAVPGMPQLYDSLSKSLPDSAFFYITASPFPLAPFLNNFLDTAFPSATGPIFTQNLTVVNPVDVIDFVKGGDKEGYKLSVIDRIKNYYPGKKWLAIGDSTQKDPEVYAKAFQKYPDSVSCIWIRKVEGADNSDARFQTAFAGVPKEKVRLFEDKQIASLAQVDVAGGSC